MKKYHTFSVEPINVFGELLEKINKIENEDIQDALWLLGQILDQIKNKKNETILDWDHKEHYLTKYKSFYFDHSHPCGTGSAQLLTKYVYGCSKCKRLFNTESIANATSCEE